jgi:type II secretory pathway pseudopilin PulG
MEIFIEHQGRQTGPYSLEQIQAGLSSGLYQPINLVWYQGASGWMPLSVLLNNLSGAVGNPYHGQSQNSGYAVASMVLGIVSFVCLITSIPAVICGHIARNHIKRSHGRLTGDGFAIAGLVTGYICLAILCIAFLAGFISPIITLQAKKAAQTEAISNAKSFGLALYEFKEEFGSYPNAQTAQPVAQKTSTPEIIGASSNARFRQLIRAGITPTETIFHAKTSSSRKPDGNITGDNAIAARECGFAYIDNTPANPSSPRPIAMAPFKPGTEEFDTKPFSAKAIILWTDGSVTTLPIQHFSGEVMHNGQHILDPTHPVWDGTPPILLLPE